MTTSLTASSFLATPLRIPCTAPTCSTLSIVTPTVSAKSYTVGTVFTPNLIQSGRYWPNDPACPVAYTVKITNSAKKDVTASVIDILFKIYDEADYRFKSYGA